MIYFYYGSLADATVTAGSGIAFESQYPVTNINYLDKNVYSHLDDNGDEAGAVEHVFDLVKIDFGSATAVSHIVADLNALRLQFNTTAGVPEDIVNFNIALYKSSDNITYTAVTGGQIYTKTVNATTADETLTDIYTETFTEVTYRYYTLRVTVLLNNNDVLAWDIDGKINNLYIGDYLTLKSPDLPNEDLEHDVDILTSYSGKRVAIERQAQRQIYYYNYGNLNDTEKANKKLLDAVAGMGTIPIYFENYEGATHIVDPLYCRITNKITMATTANANTALSQTIEEEL